MKNTHHYSDQVLAILLLMNHNLHQIQSLNEAFKEKFDYASGESIDDIPFRSGKAIAEMELEKDILIFKKISLKAIIIQIIFRIKKN